MKWVHALESSLDLISSMTDRLRARILALRGASIEQKVSLGSRVRIDRPWCLHVGKRCFFESDVYLKIVDSGASLSLGEFVFIGKGTEFDVKEKVSVGAHTVIAPGCFITDHGHGLSRLSRIDEQSCQSQEVKIGSDVWIGANVVILPGVSIGNGAVIGASAVITKDIPDYAIAVGVPARVIRHRS